MIWLQTVRSDVLGLMGGAGGGKTSAEYFVVLSGGILGKRLGSGFQRS